MAGIATDGRGTAFIPVRVIISIIVGAAIVGVVFLGFQQAQETSAQSQVESECDTLTAKLSNVVASGDTRDLSNPLASRGDTCHWEADLPSELSYLGLGVDPSPDNDGTLQGGITDTGNCIYYKTEGGDKQVIWLDEDIQFRAGSLNDGQWTIEQPDGYVIEDGGTVNLTFEAVEKQSQRYILIRADDGVPYMDRIPPDVNITAPATECYLDSPLTVTWAADDDHADIAHVDISYRSVDSSSWTSIASGVENNGTYQITNPFPDSGRYRVRVSAHDGSNTGSDTSEPISYQFPHTTLIATPCYQEENTVWIKPSSSLSLQRHHADRTHYRVWNGDGWGNWKTGRHPSLSHGGHYYIEYYSTRNGLNESSPGWQHVNNQTIYVDATSASSHVEIEGPQATETETIHKPIDVVFLIDTSGSMYDEWEDLCDIIEDITDYLANEGVDFEYTIYGLESINQQWECADDAWDIDHCESWGPATAQAAEEYDWRDGVMKVIIPVSDECAYGGGTNANSNDERSVQEAIQKCNANRVTTYPMNGDMSGGIEDVISLMDELASGTGGERYYWQDKNQVKNQLIDTILEETTTEVIAGTATSATTTHLKPEKSECEVPNTAVHYKVQHPDSETDWMTGNPGEDVSLRIFAEGSHTIKFFAEDKLGRTEEIQEKTYYIDGTPPESAVNPSSKALDEDESLTVRATDVHDPEPGMGITGVALCYRCDGGDWNFYEFDQEDLYRWNFIAPQSGDYEFESIAIDKVGNQEEGVPDGVVIPIHESYGSSTDEKEDEHQIEAKVLEVWQANYPNSVVEGSEYDLEGGSYYLVCSVKVTDENGDALPRATVKCVNADGWSSETNCDGIATLPMSIDFSGDEMYLDLLVEHPQYPPLDITEAIRLY